MAAPFAATSVSAVAVVPACPVPQGVDAGPACAKKCYRKRVPQTSQKFFRQMP